MSHHAPEPTAPLRPLATLRPRRSSHPDAPAVLPDGRTPRRGLASATLAGGLLAALLTGCAPSGATSSATRPADQPNTTAPAHPTATVSSAPNAPTPTVPGSTPAGDLRSQLTGTWRVVAATGTPTPVLTERPPTFTFDGTQFTAEPGCNHLGQPRQAGPTGQTEPAGHTGQVGYRIEDGRLAIDRAAVTARACADQRFTDQEHWFLDLVHARPLAELDPSGRLVLSADGLTVTAERTAATPPATPARPTTVGTIHRPDATAGPVPPAVTPR